MAVNNYQTFRESWFRWMAVQDTFKYIGRQSILMALQKKHGALIGLMAWLLLLAFFATRMPGTSLEPYLYLGFAGLLVIAELVETQYVKPAYLLRLRYLVGAGIVLVTVAVAWSTLMIAW